MICGDPPNVLSRASLPAASPGQYAFSDIRFRVSLPGRTVFTVSSWNPPSFYRTPWALGADFRQVEYGCHRAAEAARRRERRKGRATRLQGKVR